MSTVWNVQGYLIQLEQEIRQMRVYLEMGRHIDIDALYLWEGNLYMILCRYGLAMTKFEFVQLVPETPETKGEGDGRENIHS